MRVKATMLRTTPNGLFHISSSFKGYTGRGADDWGHVPGTSGQSPQCPALSFTWLTPAGPSVLAFLGPLPGSPPRRVHPPVACGMCLFLDLSL